MESSNTTGTEINEELEDALVYKQAWYDHTNDRNHTQFGTRNYEIDPVKPYEHYLQIRLQELAAKKEARQRVRHPSEDYVG